MDAELPVISIFSGAGGLDLGLEDAGASIRVALEADQTCVATLRANHRFFPRSTVLHSPIEETSTAEILDAASLGTGEAALLIGGPPCQPFSKSGYWLGDRRQIVDDPRAALVDEYLRVLREAKPMGFLFENVPSLAHPRHASIFEHMLEGAGSAGYAVSWWRLHALEFGVPQTRPRIVVAGLRGSQAPRPPVPTHWWKDMDRSPRRLPPETAGRWIAGLDKNGDADETITGRWAQHLTEIPPGWNYKWHTEWAGHPSPTWVTETMFWTFLLKLSPYRPSWTVQASPGPWTGPFHWDNRRLRTDELSALQTFPRSYIFEGERRARTRQIGNAVPPLLASKVGAALLRDISGTSIRRGRKLRYKLSDSYPLDESIRHRGSHW